MQNSVKYHDFIMIVVNRLCNNIILRLKRSCTAWLKYNLCETIMITTSVSVSTYFPKKIKLSIQVWLDHNFLKISCFRFYNWPFSPFCSLIFSLNRLLGTQWTQLPLLNEFIHWIFTLELEEIRRNYKRNRTHRVSWIFNENDRYCQNLFSKRWLKLRIETYGLFLTSSRKPERNTGRRRINVPRKQKCDDFFQESWMLETRFIGTNFLSDFRRWIAIIKWTAALEEVTFQCYVAVLPMISHHRDKRRAKMNPLWYYNFYTLIFFFF